MTREEQIECAAKEYSIHCIDTNEADFYKKYEEKIGFIIPKYNAFLAGAKFADEHHKSQWISVEDDLPCNHDDLRYFDTTTLVFTRLGDGIFSVAYMRKSKVTNNWNWVTVKPVIHWMPIPKLND